MTYELDPNGPEILTRYRQEHTTMNTTPTTYAPEVATDLLWQITNLVRSMPYSGTINLRHKGGEPTDRKPMTLGEIVDNLTALRSVLRDESSKRNAERHSHERAQRDLDAVGRILLRAQEQAV